MIPASVTLKGIWAALIAAAFAIVLALLVAVSINTYANLRWEGPFGLTLGFEGWKPRAVRVQREKDAQEANYIAAQAEATRLALEAKAEQERRYAELAERADNDHERNQAAASTATDRFIAANRVQPCPVGGATSGTPASPDDHGAGVPAPVPADPFVAVSDLDVRACTAAATYAIDAYKWANGLGD